MKKYESSDAVPDMYRLLNLRKAKVAQLQAMSALDSELTRKLLLGRRSCSLCKQICSTPIVFYRCHSESANAKMRLAAAKKTRPRSTNRQYVELLVVTDKFISEQKPKVQKLKPNDLKFLAMTNLNLNELYKLKSMMSSPVVKEHTYNNLTIIDNVSNFTEDLTTLSFEGVTPHNDNRIINHENHEHNIDMCDEKLVLDDKSTNIDVKKIKYIYDDPLDIITNLPAVNTFHPEIEEEAQENVEFEEAKGSVKDLEEVKEVVAESNRNLANNKIKKEIISRTLAAYTEVCNSINLPQKGLNAVLYQRRSKNANSSIKHVPINSINVYNTLLKGFAFKGNFSKVEEVLNSAKENKVELNVQSYAAIFECLGRVNIEDNHLKHIRIYTKEVLAKGISFDRIINEAVFLNDQRRWAVQAMKAYNNGYAPNYKTPDLQYCNPLLTHLNCDEQLKQNLKSTVGANNGIFTAEMLKSKVEEQIDIEKLGNITIKNIIAKTQLTEEVLKYREALADHLKLWEQSALSAFNRDLASAIAQRSHLNLEPYLRCIPTKDFISIIIDEAKLIAQGSETYSPTVGMLHLGLGQKVYSRYKVFRKKKSCVLDKVEKIHLKYCEDYLNCHGELGILPDDGGSNVNPRQKWQLIETSFRSHGASIDLDHQAWVPSVIVAIGKFLYNIIMHDIKIDTNVMRGNSKSPHYLPAFYTVFRHQSRIVKEELKPHPTLVRLCKASVPGTLTFPSYEIPMKCPPVPWCSTNTGGYLVTTCDLLRLPTHAFTQRQRLQEARLNELYPSFDSLNQLAAVPWKVNERILDVILEVFTKGGSAKLDVPELPEALPPPPDITPGMNKAQSYAIFRGKLQYRRKKAEMYSLWCDCLYKLSLANHYRNDIFWLPHNMDFRGRVYPVPPHLNHLGSDLSRSMLIFAESRPLGPHGLDWLKIHLINLTGFKKRDSIKDRLSYANGIMVEILDSADYPLTGRKWWATSDEPWQTLTCCMEIATAVRSPDPEKYRSHFPVHQDGSCNGLQHYAALGRDSAGAFSVNLVSTNKPQDVYSAVAALVEERRQKDAGEGYEVAKSLEGFVKRKVIKQTVMTTVYGVTRYGARLQIARQLKDLDNFPKESVWAASSYLTSCVFESLRTMFTSTREIQDWFTECAKVISSVSGRNVEWVTPLGLPIVQPYFKYTKLMPSSNGYENFHIDKYEKPNVMKQKNAFPPNFVHSLDSSHMMLTSLHCERAGITFVSVHDCYWTHPSTVHIMNKICREQFVALHSEPILENLSVFLTETYSYEPRKLVKCGSASDASKKKLNYVLSKLPKTGNFNIKEVLNSVYFFS